MNMVEDLRERDGRLVAAVGGPIEMGLEKEDHDFLNILLTICMQTNGMQKHPRQSAPLPYPTVSLCTHSRMPR